MEITNKTLAMFLLVAIFISLIGTILSLDKLNSHITGFASATGTTNFSVQSQATLIFWVSGVDYGTGYVNISYTNCTMAINGSSAINRGVGCVGFNANNPLGVDAFIIQNTGNVRLNVTINSTANGTTFPGGSTVTPLFMYAISNNETSACAAINTTLGAWTNVSIPDVPVCNQLNYTPGPKTFRIGINITIPINSLPGSKTVTLYANAVQTT